MKKQNRHFIVFFLFALLSVFLTGCNNRSDVAHAYDLFNTTEPYRITSQGADPIDHFFASDLCVGGTQDTISAIDLSTDAQSAAVFSIKDQKITYAQNIYKKSYPASTTKILTAYLALKYGTMDDILTVSTDAIDSLEEGSSVCGLHAGDQISLKTALYGLLICSGNDAANVIAEYISGSRDAFASLMNQEAAALGATQSHFVNPHGLHDEDHYTTAYDLYLIFNEAIQNDDFVDIISTRSYKASYTDQNGQPFTVTWQNTNGYLSGLFPEPDHVTVIGGKTGTTDEAGRCLVLYSKNEEGDPIISIVLNANSKQNLYLFMSELLSNFSN